MSTSDHRQGSAAFSDLWRRHLCISEGWCCLLMWELVVPLHLQSSCNPQMVWISTVVKMAFWQKNIMSFESHQKNQHQHTKSFYRFICKEKITNFNYQIPYLSQLTTSAHREQAQSTRFYFLSQGISHCLYLQTSPAWMVGWKRSSF